MSIDIPRPNINAPTEAGRLEQVRSYLYQMAEQLNFALNSVERQMETTVLEASKQTSSEPTPEEVQSNFNSIKSLIIKSADIVDSYSEAIKKKLEGYYVAESDFGTYREDTSALFEANSKSFNAMFENVQEIDTTLSSLKGEYSRLIETEAYIKSGKLDDDPATGAAVYGIEVGQTNTIDGVEVFDKFARFTSDRLSFFDKNDVEVAYISDYTLVITKAEINVLILGGYEIDTSDGLTFKWIGGVD